MKKLTPFNVKLLQLDNRNLLGLRRITSLDTMDNRTKNFHEEGFFSVEIFGRMGSKERMDRFAYIDIKVPVLHPLVVRILGKLKRIYPEILMGKTYAKWDPVTQDFVKSDQMDGETGYAFFMKYLDAIKLPERLSDQRALNIQFIQRTKAIALNDKIIVSPAGYRDYMISADGREEEDEVNPIYRRILKLANAVSPEVFKTDPAVYDRARAGLQASFTELYEYFEKIVEGKHGMMYGKVLTRQIHDGTRNVITTQNLTIKRLFDPAAPTVNSGGIGLFQFVKAYRLVMIHPVRNGFISEIFSSPGAAVRLVNKTTLKEERVIISNEAYDSWLTTEGIERLFNYYGEESIRHNPIEVEGFYLGLIYNDGLTFRVFSNIDELPADMDRKFVSPITYTEFLYIYAYPVASHVTMNLTRFPITGFGSIVPALPYLKPTLTSVSLKPLGDDWLVDEDKPVAYNFPVRGAAFLNTMMPPPNKLQNQTADFDGDKETVMGVVSKEAVAESKKVMSSRNFYIRTDGSIAHSVNTDTVKYLMAGMTGKPKVAAPVVAKEGQASFLAKDLDTSKLDQKIMAELSKYPKLLKSLDMFIHAPHPDLAKDLKELEVLSRKFYTKPASLTVYRGFNHAFNLQNSVGVGRDAKVGDSFVYEGAVYPISTSTDIEISRGFGGTIVTTELTSKDDYLIISPEMYAAVAKMKSFTRLQTQSEVIILPPATVTFKLLEVPVKSKGIITIVAGKIADAFGGLFGRGKGALEVYQEGEDDTFTHWGEHYNLNAIFRSLGNPKPKLFTMKQLEWNVRDHLNPERVAKASTSYPLLVAVTKGRVFVLDGNHRLKRLFDEGAETVSCIVVPPEILEAAKRPKPKRATLGTAKERVNLGTPSMFYEGTKSIPMVETPIGTLTLTGTIYSIEHHGLEPEDISIKEELNWVLEDADKEIDFESRARGIRKDAPIIATREMPGSEGKLFVIDGWPEVMRAVESGTDTIQVYLVPSGLLKPLRGGDSENTY